MYMGMGEDHSRLWNIMTKVQDKNLECDYIRGQGQFC